MSESTQGFNHGALGAVVAEGYSEVKEGESGTVRCGTVSHRRRGVHRQWRFHAPGSRRLARALTRATCRQARCQTGVPASETRSAGDWVPLEPRAAKECRALAIRARWKLGNLKVWQPKGVIHSQCLFFLSGSEPRIANTPLSSAPFVRGPPESVARGEKTPSSGPGGSQVPM